MRVRGKALVFKILLLIHVGGAIIGLGPTMTFAVLGKLSEIAETPPAKLAIMEAISNIERKLVTPVALVTQPVSGVLLIFKLGLNKHFFANYWLWISILLFTGILSLSYGVSSPSVKTVIAKMRAGTFDETAMAAVKKIKTVGPLIGIMFLIVIVLMILRPGFTA
ncbi:MAG: DUF2269 family protein [Actinomycetota bacterium]